MSVTAALFIGLPEPLARLYTDERDVLALAAILLPIAGVFQVFDGLQVVAVGLLRGLGDTRVPMLLHMIAFWLIGTPLSIFFALALELGAGGLWWGRVAGLAAVAVLLVLRVRARERRELVRIEIDERTPSGRRDTLEPAVEPIDGDERYGRGGT